MINARSKTKQTLPRLLALAPLLLAALALPAQAAILVEDPFDIGTGPGEYTAGNPLDDGSTGQPANIPTTGGWAGAWDSGNVNATSQSGGLEYTAIPGVTIGGSGTGEGHINTGGSGGPVRKIASNATLGSASELWMRILWQPNSTLGPEFFNFRRDAGGSADGRIVIRRSDSTTFGNPAEKMT